MIRTYGACTGADRNRYSGQQSSLVADKMKCIICFDGMAYYFTKQFSVYGLGAVDYWRCSSCGFVASKTHYDMTDAQWEALNLAFHSDSNAREDNPYNRNQRYFNQALMLHLMERGELLKRSEWLDWGSGVGNVSIQLQQWFSLQLLNFDAFVRPTINSVVSANLKKRGYSLVVNTAVFEHVRDRKTLDEIESYVSEDGHLAVHTLVRGQIPSDPEWMYLLPVHCSFHTNKSMQMLMNQWKYTCSVYNEHSKMWIMFKRPSAEIGETVQRLNSSLGYEYFHFKEGFMDYWP